MRYLLLFVILLTGCVHVPFDSTDKTLIAASSVVLLADWKQTSDIHERPFHSENNPLLGRYPSHLEMGGYFTGCLLGNYVVAYLLPPTYRKIWLSSLFVVEFNVVRDNHLNGNLGLRTTW